MMHAALRQRLILALIAAFVLVIPCAARAFDFSDVAQVAKNLAAKPYQAPASIPGFLANLSYDQYRQIRFQPEDSLWRQSHTNFQVMLVAPGKYFQHPVQINIVDASGVHTLPFHKRWFVWPAGIAKKVPDDLGYAGFKLTFPLNQPGAHNQFLVFAGASYFRGVARNQRFGVSARGIAVDTGLASGEEFPNFTRFWLVRPGARAKVMEVYALLNGPSLTGAYQFVIFPGAPTRVEVHARLFVRKPIALLGLAPLTSMFFYGKNTPRPDGEWRRAVHDSGGLLIHSGTGEWLWRPLVNPTALKLSYFAANSPLGFGLLQRDTRFAGYEDSEARYDARPSVWVTTHEDWGQGHVVLVEIPSDAETNDNIVAFWSPKKSPATGQTYDLHYTLRFGAPTVPDEPMARAVATYVGFPHAEDTSQATHDYRVVVDFAGGGLADLKPDAKVQANVTGLDGTEIKGMQVHFVEPSRRWRLSILAAPAAGKPLALRAFLKQGGATLSETWTYSLSAKNRFHAGG